jgi:hypothetical protein
MTTKAYHVFVLSDIDGDYTDIVKASSAERAKNKAWFRSRCYFPDIVARRVPELDNVQLTTANIIKANFGTNCDGAGCDGVGCEVILFDDDNTYFADDGRAYCANCKAAQGE